MNLSALASQILAYLETHPHAIDSVDGIAVWWLSSRYAPADIIPTLEKLAEDGLVERIPLRDGGVAYGRLAGSRAYDHQRRLAGARP